MLENRSRKFNLCQYNIGRVVAPLDDPKMAGFVGEQGRVYGIAESDPGFVWRLQPDSESGHGSVLPFPDDPRMTVGLTVWNNLEALRNFVYKNDHAELVRKRRQWFEELSGPTNVLWWLPAGEIPTIDEGKRRLDRLAAQGPSPLAFTFKVSFPPPLGLAGTLSPEGTNGAHEQSETLQK